MGVISLKIHRAINMTREHAESGHFVLEIENGEVASGTASTVAISCFSGELRTLRPSSRVCRYAFFDIKNKFLESDLNWMEATDLGSGIICRKLFLIALSVSNLRCVTAEE